MSETSTGRASLVQDLWIGTTPRLRARRFAPWDEVDAGVRIAFHLELGRDLDEPEVAGFLECLGAMVEVIALEARGEVPPPPPESEARLRRILDVDWRDELPLVVAGHGTGATIAAAAADHARVRAVVVLTAPGFDAAAVRRPLLLVRRLEEIGEAVGAAAGTTLMFAGDAHAAVLVSPWPEIVAAWARAAVHR